MRWNHKEIKKRIIEIGLDYANGKIKEKLKDSLNITQLQNWTYNPIIPSSLWDMLDHSVVAPYYRSLFKTRDSQSKASSTYLICSSANLASLSMSIFVYIFSVSLPVTTHMRSLFVCLSSFFSG